TRDWPWSSRLTRWTMPRAARRSWRPAGSGRLRPRREHEMAIFLNGESRIMIQGITGSEGSKHGRRMLAAGTTVVGGTNPRKAGQTVDLGGSAVPVFATVAETTAATGADVSVVFVPPAGAKSAVIEAVVADVAGFTGPEGKTMGQAGAIVSGSSGTAQAKKEALEKVGVRVGRTPSETARLVREVVPGH